MNNFKKLIVDEEEIYNKGVASLVRQLNKIEKCPHKINNDLEDFLYVPKKAFIIIQEITSPYVEFKLLEDFDFCVRIRVSKDLEKNRKSKEEILSMMENKYGYKREV